MNEVVYMISYNSRCLYIGRTNNFQRRIAEHLKTI